MKIDVIVEAGLPAARVEQLAVQAAWFKRQPDLDMVEFYRRWWKWMNAKPEHLALVRLNYEAAALDTSVTGLAGEVRADQIGVWRHAVEERMLAAGVAPDQVELEGVLAKATFTGLIIDLIATGERRRLTVACEVWLERLASTLTPG